MSHHDKFRTSKTLRVNEDTHLRMTATYTRRARAVDKKKLVKRSFDLVVKGILISSTLLSSLAFAKDTHAAMAQTYTDMAYKAPEYVAPVRTVEDQQMALVSNLRMAVKVLDASIKSGEISADFFDKVTKSIHTIDAYLLANQSFVVMDQLVSTVNQTDAVLRKDIPQATKEILERREQSQIALANLQNRMSSLGIEQGVVTQQAPKKEAEVTIASYKPSSDITVIINGQVQSFPQPPVAIDGTTLVPLRGIFEALGAKVEWDGATQTVSAVKGDIQVSVQLNNKTGYVNGKAIPLNVAPQAINGSTMVPLRFISESLGAKVEWDGATRTVTITTEQGQPQSQVQDQVQPKDQTPAEEQTQAKDTTQYGYDYWGYGVKIKVKYGNHDYGVKSQQEYDEVMKIVNEALQGLDSFELTGKYVPYFDQYIKGDRPENYTDKRSEIYRGLVGARSEIGDLVEAGVSRDTIMEVLKIRTMAKNLLIQAESVDGPPRSAYDALVRKIDDCDSTAQTYSAFFDAMGYDTAIRTNGSHSEAYVKINGTWFQVVGFHKTNLHPSNTFMAPPTSGSL